MRMFTRKTSRRRCRRPKFVPFQNNEKQLQKYVGGTYKSFLPDLGINNTITNFFAWIAKCKNNNNGI